MSLRVIFMGTPEFALSSLEALYNHSGVELLLVVTRPDAPQGRGLKLVESPVKHLAENLRIPVSTPSKINDPEFVKSLQDLKPDLILTAAFGLFLGSAILKIPQSGCLNIHASILPKYRGASPIQRAIINGESETGLTVFRIVKEMDAGDILMQEKLSISSDETAGELHDRLGRLASVVTQKTIDAVLSGKETYTPQAHEKATFAPKLKKEDGHINWDQEAKDVFNQIRGVTPWPGAYGSYQGSRLKFHRTRVLEADQTFQAGTIIKADNAGICVGCRKGQIVIDELQMAGGRLLRAQEFLCGHNIKPGDIIQ